MHVINCNTAREIWTKLSNVYQRDNEQQRYVQEFFNYTMVKTEDVSTHVNKLQNLVYRIRALGIEISHLLISKRLVTLPENYKSFIIVGIDV